MSFQDNLRRAREKAGYESAKDFAQNVLGIKYTTYLAYEGQEGREPKYDRLCEIAAALHVTTDELLGYSLDEYARCKSIAVSAGYSITEKDDLVYISTSTRLYSKRGTTELPVSFSKSRQQFIEIIMAAYESFKEKTKQQLYDEVLLNIMCNPDQPDKAQ